MFVNSISTILSLKKMRVSKLLSSKATNLDMAKKGLKSDSTWQIYTKLVDFM